MAMSPGNAISHQIRVKTARGRLSWPMGSNTSLSTDIQVSTPSCRLSSGPELFSVPGAVFRKVIRESHQVWLDTPDVEGQKHKDNKIRMLHYEYKNLDLPSAPSGWMEEFRDAWELLGES